ncbi:MULTISPECIES: DsrE family protein [unclassified Bradyrhizobium]|uniref:DsrE family protein n=1 Tax=unclassified Bradyrhizobium TaxID=2631580 RepID=UPI000423B720|nr:MULTISPECIES: DsrE family protein [unclassified Bradyrhizobium]MCP3464772.1 DsrE family protein [Bradyrhizobium sp. CCGUVB23]
MRSARIQMAAALLATFALTSAHAMNMKQSVGGRAAKPAPHRLVIQVDQNDPGVMNLALNNATNVLEYYRKKGEDADVEIVAFGPGLHMLRADTTPVAERIHAMKDLAFPGKVRFAACGVTREGMEKKEGKPLELVPEASMVPSGVVHMMELQEKGWSYVRP